MEELEPIEQRVRKRIGEISNRPKNVTLSDIEWVAKKLEQLGYKVRQTSNSGHHLFVVNEERFGVVSHNPGEKQIKPCYAYEFLRAMANLGLLEEE